MTQNFPRITNSVTGEQKAILVLFQQAVLLQKQGLFDQALNCYDQAIVIDFNFFEAHYRRALFLHEQKRLEEALVSYHHAVALRPDFAAAYANLGVVLKKLHRLEASLTNYNRAIELNPTVADVYSNRGNLFKEWNRFDEALADYNRAIELKPDSAVFYSNRGHVLKAMKRLKEALADYDQAIQLQPNHADHYNLRGNILRDLKQLDAAIASYDRAIELYPGFFSAYSNRGAVLRESGRLEDALLSYNRAIELNPQFADAYSNRGNALRDLRRFDEALASHQRALELKPNAANIYYNMGVVLYDLKRIENALACYDKALHFNPNYVDAHWNKSISCLLNGDFIHGWQEYEWRWRRPESPGRQFTQSLWLGAEDICNKTILIYTEQGFGDTLQFCRYLPLLAQRGAKIILEISPALNSLLSSLNGIEKIIEKGQPLPEFDYQCPLLSLPLVFETEINTIPAQIPYLFANLEKIAHWKSRLGVKQGFRIGLVWSGSPTHKNDKNRSLPLIRLLQVMPAEAQLYSLQKQVRAEDQITLNARPDVADFSASLIDFSDTAALITQMDLIISVDTSVAHLAGALGKPVWVLLPFVPDWRWLLDREDSPWYPGMKLWRQLQLDDWNGILAHLKSALAQPEKLMLLPVESKNSVQDELAFQQAIQHYQKNNLLEATTACHALLKENPRFFAATHLLGVIALKQSHHEQAIYFLSQAVDLNPFYVIGYLNLGHAYRLQQRWAEAVLNYDRVIQLKPDFEKVYEYRIVALKKLAEQLAATLISYGQTPEQYSDAASVYYNYGFVLQALGRLPEALESYYKAIRMQPNYLVAYNNAGIILRKLNRVQDAIHLYQRAIDLQPTYASAQWNQAICRLLLGDFEQGWIQYEWRWQHQKNLQRHFTQPVWSGKEELQGKTILLHAEQGLGDTLQFCRYAALVAHLGAKVFLEVQAELQSLLEDSLVGIHQVIIKGQMLPVCDYHCSLLSLPMVFKTTLATVPASIPYLMTNQQKANIWKKQLGHSKNKRLGLVWSGGKIHRDDAERSLPLVKLLSVLSEDFALYSLQKEVRPEDQMTLNHRSNIYHFGPELCNFSDTAALLSHMDLVISVDTSVAHLAGALGKPVWILLPFIPDWRWLLDREDSPWYSSARLFRQSQVNDWDSALDHLRQALKAWVKP